jgi:hypothetical protein
MKVVRECCQETRPMTCSMLLLSSVQKQLVMAARTRLPTITCLLKYVIKFIICLSLECWAVYSHIRERVARSSASLTAAGIGCRKQRHILIRHKPGGGECGGGGGNFVKWCLVARAL